MDLYTPLESLNLKKKRNMTEEQKKVTNLIATKEFAIAELQAITNGLPLSEMRSHLQEAINLLNEAEEVLNYLESEEAFDFSNLKDWEVPSKRKSVKNGK